MKSKKKLWKLLIYVIAPTLNNTLLSNKNCHKGFDEEQNFKKHIESVHEGKKPYECDICG